MDSLIERIRARIADGPPCDHPNEWLPVQPPTRPERVAEAEAELGFALPVLLRWLYTEIGNGGFGLLPLSRASLGDRPPVEAELDLVGQYRWIRSASPDRVAWSGWRPGLVPAFYCGATAFEFVDCLVPDGPVVPLDLGTDMDALPPIGSLADRLEEWLAGRYPW